MKVETKQIDGLKIIKLSGQVRISTQNEFKDFFDSLVKDNGKESVIVNMDGVGYMNSAGIGIIVDSYKRFKEQDGRMVLCNLASDIKKLFEVTKLNKFIEIYTTEAEAIEKLSVTE